MHDTYDKLLSMLDEYGAAYRLIDHKPEGGTEAASLLRGNALAQAAKCIVVLVKVGKRSTRYVLAVVPGDMRVNIGAIKALYDGTYAGFAPTDAAERLSGCVSGAILPFSLSEELNVVVDPTLLEHDEIYFNAARLDRSMALATSDYRAVARPRIEAIAQS